MDSGGGLTDKGDFFQRKLETVEKIHKRVGSVLFNSVGRDEYRQDLITGRIAGLLQGEGIPLDALSAKLLSIMEMLLDFYHYFVDLKRQTREGNQLFVNDVLQEINREILRPLKKRGYPLAMLFPQSSHWLAFALLPLYKDNPRLFIHRLRAVAEYSAEASAIVLIIMASEVRQGRHQFKYKNFLNKYIPLLTSQMIRDIDNFFRNQDHSNAKRMAFALINGLMVPVRDGSEYSRALNQWVRIWRNRGVDPRKIIKEIFERFPEFIHAKRLKSRFVAGRYAAGEDISFIAGLLKQHALARSIYEIVTAAHSVTTAVQASGEAGRAKELCWRDVPFEIDHMKAYVGYEQKTGLAGLFNMWSMGRSCSDELILQARRLGFRGHLIRHGKEKPFTGYTRVVTAPPAAFGYLKMLFIYQMGAYENLIQHAGGNGVYLWRETLHGYEFIMFDHGRGVRDIHEDSLSLESLRRIFDYGVTFREGKRGPGRTEKESGLGKSFFYLANETYLTRLISITKDGKIQIVEKLYPGKDQGEQIDTIGAEFFFEELGFVYRYATGVIVQGFVPFDQGYRTVEYAPISEDALLGEVVARNSEGKSRGPWQIPPKNDVLDELFPKDRVRFVLHDAEEVEETVSFTRVVSHAPSAASPQFVFNDGSILALSGIVALAMGGRKVLLADYDNPLDGVADLSIFSLDEITVFAKGKELRVVLREMEGDIAELPSAKTQGAFRLRCDDGTDSYVGPEQICGVELLG